MFGPEQEQGQGPREECSLERDQENLKTGKGPVWSCRVPPHPPSPCHSFGATVLSAGLSPDLGLSCPVCLQPVSEGCGGGLPCSFPPGGAPLSVFCPSHGYSSSKCKKLPAARLPVSGSGELMTAKPPAPGGSSGQGRGSQALGTQEGSRLAASRWS